MAMIRALVLAAGLLVAAPAWACTWGTHVAGCDDSLTATTVATIVSKRQQLINNAWGSPTLPTTQATQSTLSSDGIAGNPMNPNAPTNCTAGTQYWDGITDPGGACPWWPMATQRVDQFVTNMGSGQTVSMRFFFAAASNNKHRFVAINPGHSHTCKWELDWMHFNMMPVTLGLLNAGYSVLQMVMPPGAGSTPPAGGWSSAGGDNPSDPCGSPANHVSLFTSYGDTAMRFFLEPLTQVINYMAAAPPSYFPDSVPFADYNIAGLSGGGWTCTVYAAIDTRIHNAICIAGSTPGLNFADALGNCGDNEQCNPTFYTIAGWLDLYAMASQGQGRLHRQILNQNDHCCFGATQWVGSGSAMNYQAYYSTGGAGAAQCNNVASCTWGTYLDWYSDHVITPNLTAIAPANNPRVIKDTQSNTHQISVCTSATGGNAAFHGLTPCTGTSIDGGTTPQIDALSVTIATLDGNPASTLLASGIAAGGTRGLRLGGR
jgi:hypothetical protein